MNRSTAFTSRLVPFVAFTLTAFCITGSILLAPHTALAEEFEAKHCVTGEWTLLEFTAPWSRVWKEKGSLISDNSRLDKSTTQCGGVAEGSSIGKGYALCVVKNPDGDVFRFRGNYDFFPDSKVTWSFSEGSGKWNGISGQIESREASRKSDRTARTCEACYQWKVRLPS